MQRIWVVCTVSEMAVRCRTGMVKGEVLGMQVRAVRFEGRPQELRAHGVQQGHPRRRRWWLPRRLLHCRGLPAVALRAAQSYLRT